ncbi:CAP-Gly domain-containing protein [Nephila pilipes]|uniref:CAP-Gly domain-containing protein n=1 Tax=Nephila pilipes TaxID=299642 RepID=A0A8X6QW88_NEPPI|nr:CAP-Gly domain-containing protein [Nephila pilipes]
MGNFKLDDRVKVIGKNVKGKIAFIGKTHFTEGIMFGIILDKPRGRNNGTVGDVIYFTCPENHGVFVRSCQLETDYEDSSDCSDSSIRDVVSRPAYPNYLKYSSKIKKRFKLNFKNKKHTVKRKTILKQNTQPQLEKKPQISQEIETNFVNKENCISEPKMIGIKQSPRKRSQRYIEVDEELGFLVKKLNERNQQIDLIHRNLKKMKTYLRWNRRFDVKRDPIRIILDNVIDTVIKNMEEIIDDGDKGICQSYSNEDKDLEKENSALIQQVWDLDKRNRKLTQCMTQIRDILLGSWIRSQALLKNKCKNDREKIVEKENTKNKHGNSSLNKKEGNALCSKIEGFRDCPKKSKQTLNENLLFDAQESKEFECVKKHPDLSKNNIGKLNLELGDTQKDYSKEKKNSTESEFKRETNLSFKSSKTTRKKLTLDESNKKFRENDSPLLQRVFLQSPKKLFRTQSYNASQRKNHDEKASSETSHDVGELSNPAKEVFELISSIMGKIEETEQIGTSTKKESSTETPHANMNESDAGFKKCSVVSDSGEIEKNSDIWTGSKSENNFKSSKSEISKDKKSRRKKLYSTPIKDERKRLISHPTEI